MVYALLTKMTKSHILQGAKHIYLMGFKHLWLFAAKSSWFFKSLVILGDWHEASVILR